MGKTNDDRLRGPRWEAVKEVWGAFDAFGEGDEQYSVAFGRDIIASIPPGSIYFGGTDPGRFLVTALCRSQVSGDWLKDDTTVAEVAAFAEKTFGRQDFSGFKGDPRFIPNAYSHRMFSKLRSSIAGLYAWRVSHAAGGNDQARMVREADFAFRQAWALCPDSPEAVFRYVNFLVAQKRFDDAILVAETATRLPASKGNAQLGQLVTQLKRYRMNQAQ